MDRVDFDDGSGERFGNGGLDDEKTTPVKSFPQK
jgi:hypothetical protein